MDLKQRVDLYFANVKRRDLDGLLSLFASDATMILPDGTELTGSAAIRTLFSALFAAQTTPTPMGTIVSGDQAASEIETQLPDGRIRRTANFYQFNSEGLIKRLSHYARVA